MALTDKEYLLDLLENMPDDIEIFVAVEESFDCGDVHTALHRVQSKGVIFHREYANRLFLGGHM